MDWMLWEKDVVLLAAAFGILKEGLLESAPTLASFQSQLQVAGTRATAAKIEVDFNAALARWQAVNTAIYWHVLASLKIEGAHFLSDMRAVDSLYRLSLIHI